MKRYGWVWPLLAGCMTLCGFGLIVVQEAWLDIWRIANRSEEASHIFLVPVVAVWMVWVRRERLRHLQPTPSLIGPALIVAGWLISNFGERNLFESLWHGGAVLVFIGCLVTLVGGEVLRRFLPAFVILVFLVPVPGLIRQQIALPLQQGVARATTAVFDVIGVDVLRSGNVITIDGRDVAIAEACNGMRMVFALVLVSFAFAFGTPLRPLPRLLVVLASPLVALACNVVRLVPTVWLYGVKPEVADAFHDASGWLMLPIAFGVLLAGLRLLRWALVPVTQYTLAYD